MLSIGLLCLCILRYFPDYGLDLRLVVLLLAIFADIATLAIVYGL